ncbi:hypothetical protein BACCAP_00049 [Pseudoflavonifractor capillosus ATCC 29799]|uniref:Uncharacterized protein n=1 Tax=Pseudoflavonifractor capillosus ATCC 29799 TaxID=411467 RepID=A6NPD4_9FIRM|nr:hypothetical protein BACCAP_00049 [Pseudoflavonifractor capillosus ATCC 29799]
MCHAGGWTATRAAYDLCKNPVKYTGEKIEPSVLTGAGKSE